MDFTIRDAKPADATGVVAVVREMADEDNEHTPITENSVSEYLASPASGILVAERSGRIEGLLGYSIRPGLFHAAPSCLIELLVIRKAFRNRGAGGALVEALLARAAALGCAEVSASAMPDNAGAIRFYRRHGLTEECLYLERHFSAKPPRPEN